MVEFIELSFDKLGSYGNENHWQSIETVQHHNHPPHIQPVHNQQDPWSAWTQVICYIKLFILINSEFINILCNYYV